MDTLQKTVLNATSKETQRPGSDKGSEGKVWEYRGIGVSGCRSIGVSVKGRLAEGSNLEPGTRNRLSSAAPKARFPAP
jgi:hypothetical protein